MSHLVKAQLLGCSETHLSPLPNHANIKVHQGVVAPLCELITRARDAGFALRVASGFRSFERQLLIWNDKCRGAKPILDAHGCALDMQSLSAQQKILAILRWSALPGASRHHWGTECDIYDAAAVDNDYVLQLHPREYTANGPFAPMMAWLSEYLQQADCLPFYRPYLSTKPQGVAAEPWHISYRPIASECAKQFSLSLLREHLQQVKYQYMMEEQQLLLDNLETIYEDFIRLPHAPILPDRTEPR